MKTFGTRIANEAGARFRRLSPRGPQTFLHVRLQEEDRTDVPELSPCLNELEEASRDSLGLASLGGGSHSLSFLLPLSSIHLFLAHFIILGHLDLNRLLLLPSLRNEQRAVEAPMERLGCAAERGPDCKSYLLG